jgi:hypothetical protein
LGLFVKVDNSNNGSYLLRGISVIEYEAVKELKFEADSKFPISATMVRIFG